MMFLTLVMAATISASNCFKLSDLPVLKKFEIPNHHGNKNVGRKHKDLDSVEVKRSHYWEPKPEFTANELDWFDDPEKVMLDFNYKDFLDDSETSPVKEGESSKLIESGLIEKLAGGRKRDVIIGAADDDEKIDKAFVRSLITPRSDKPRAAVRPLSGKKSMLKPKKKSTKGKNLKKKSTEEKKGRSRRSLFDDVEEDNEYDEERYKRSLDDEGERYLNDRKDYDYRYRRSVDKYEDLFPREVEAKEEARSATAIADAVDVFDEREKRDIISDFLSKRSEVQTVKKRSKKDRQMEAQVQSRKTAEQILKARSKVEGVLGDEQPAKSNTSKPPSEAAAKAKTQDVKASTREKIPKKFNMDNVPNNVARAVAMAMEQLKRDKMWGKVFVHVRPSGQLKVMVQETRKMEDDANN